MAPTLKPFADLLGVDEATVRKVLLSWGPGKYDAELNQDGKALRPDGKTAATLLPAAFGLAGVNLHTYTGWGSVTHWNAYVANTQMHGKGTFFDPRLNDRERSRSPCKAGHGNMRSNPDLVTPKLAALHYYQLSIPAPEPPADSFDAAAAERGQAVFEGKAQCATCHVPPLFTEPGWPMHTAEEMGIDDFQASRSPDKTSIARRRCKGLFVRDEGRLLPRRPIRDLSRRGRSLRPAVRAPAEPGGEGAARRVPEIALASGGSRVVADEPGDDTLDGDVARVYGHRAHCGVGGLQAHPGPLRVVALEGRSPRTSATTVCPLSALTRLATTT